MPAQDQNAHSTCFICLLTGIVEIHITAILASLFIATVSAFDKSKGQSFSFAMMDTYILLSWIVVLQSTSDKTAI